MRKLMLWSGWRETVIWPAAKLTHLTFQDLRLHHMMMLHSFQLCLLELRKVLALHGQFRGILFQMNAYGTVTSPNGCNNHYICIY